MSQSRLGDMDIPISTFHAQPAHRLNKSHHDYDLMEYLLLEAIAFVAELAHQDLLHLRSRLDHL